MSARIDIDSQSLLDMLRKISTIAVLICCLCIHMPAAQAEVKVIITGVDDRLRGELSLALALERKTDLQYAISPASIRALYLRSLSDIADVLQANGYYNHEVSDSLRQEGEDWVAEFNIQPGPPVIINSLLVELVGEGSDDPELGRTVNEFPLTVDMTLNHSLYESGKRRILNLANDRGYLDAIYRSHTISINNQEHTARIDLVLDTGRRYLFGTVNMPDTVIDRDILDRYIPFRDGAPYDANQLIVFGQKLRDSNYFDEAIVYASQQDAQDYRIPITVVLTPRPENNIRAGVGYGTDSGPRLVASWDNRYINRRGHRLDTDLRLSQTTSDITGSYAMPDFRGNGAELDLLSSLSTEKTDTSISDAFRLGVRQGRLVKSWNEAVSLVYQYESFKVADEGNNTRLLMPELRYWKTSADAAFYTNSGYRLNFNLKGAARGALSDMTFIQAVISGKYIRPVAGHGRFIARGEAGASYVPEFSELPASIRFFAGGDNSIRGFDVQALGPLNDDGQVIGGKYLTVGSLEYEHRLNDKWGVAVFSDFGNAYNDFSDRFVYSTGLGLRWKTPVGPLRVDVAAGLSEDDVPFRLHINIGPDL